eukprot:3130257-Amphidinium_carterae.2
MPKAGAEAPMSYAAALVVLWAAECGPWASAAAASIWHVKHTWKRRYALIEVHHRTVPMCACHTHIDVQPG